MIPHESPINLTLNYICYFRLAKAMSVSWLPKHNFLTNGIKIQTSYKELRHRNEDTRLPCLTVLWGGLGRVKWLEDNKPLKSYVKNKNHMVERGGGKTTIGTKETIVKYIRTLSSGPPSATTLPYSPLHRPRS